MSEIICGKCIDDEVKRALDGCALVVTDGNVKKLYGELSRGAFVIEAGEKNKTPETLFDILGAMSDKKLKRGDTVAALGGGVVGDITGLAAALYMRGIAWINVPTTLLAMVDSSIGGKTAVDFRGIKNLVGAFWLPSKVVINSSFLRTLDDREWLCGMGELVKTCFLDASAFELLKKNIYKLKARDADVAYKLIEVCAKLKDDVVTHDFKESGLRKILNVGHTVGHALESADGFELSHGEYVIKGMTAELAMLEENVDKEFYSAALDILLSLSPPPTARACDIIDAACADKKNAGDTVAIMLPVNAGEIREFKLSREDFSARYDRAVKAVRE